jgi:hypothetical protein
MFIGQAFVGRCDGCPSLRDFFLEQDANRPLVQFGLKNKVSNTKVGCVTDVSEGLGADTLSLQERFEKGNYFFFGPIAKIARIDFMHPARR